MKASQRLHGINEYYFSQKLREIELLNQQGKKVINLGIGSPDLPPHPSVIEALAMQAVHPGQHAYQSYKGSAVLRNAIAAWYQKWYGVQLNADTEVLPLIGSKEGIMHICMSFLQQGDTALVPNPGYPTYRSAVQLAGAQPIGYNLSAANNWMPDFDELNRLIREHGCKLLFVNYPQMPTGQLPTDDLFSQLVAFAKEKDILLVHDNPYSFILNNQPKSLLSVPGALEVAIELNSLSKSHNMAGWRVGMLLGSQQHVNEVLRFKSNMDSGMFLPVQLAAAKALELDEQWHRELNEIYMARREKAFELLNLLGCSFSKEQAGMFVWARVKDGATSQNHELGAGGEWSDKILQQAGVFITPGGIFGSNGLNYLRVSLCSPIEKLEEAIQRIKAQVK